MFNISKLKEICLKEDRVHEFLLNNSLSNKFSSLFGSIFNAFYEVKSVGKYKLNDEIKKMQYKEIKKIVKKLAYIGVDPFNPPIF